MKIVWLAVLLAGAVAAVAPQENKGTLEGRVTRVNSSEGIAGVQVTLQGPSPLTFSTAAISALYTPNPAMTAAMRAEVDSLVATAPLGTTAEVIARAAASTEARLLNLPLPPVPVLPQPMGVVTDSGGGFSFKDLAPGRYAVRARREGYLGPPLPGLTVMVGAPIAASATVTVLPGEPTPPVAMEMLRGATISGRVRDPNDNAPSGMQVSAFRVGYQNGRAILQEVASQTTDDRGEYRLFWLGPGDFYVAAVPRWPSNLPGPQDTYAITFHPGVIDARTASLITLTEGAETAGMDITVRGDATGRIAGKVISPYVLPNGQPSLASTFFLVPVEQNALGDPAGPNFRNMSENRNNGQFEIRGFLPGTYDLFTSVSDGGTPSRTMWGRTRVNVTRGTIEDVTIAIKPGVEVKARLTVDGAAPAYTMQPPAQGFDLVPSFFSVPTFLAPSVGVVTQTASVPTPFIRLTLRPKESFNALFETNQNVVFDPSGVFVFPNVPEGKYTIQASVTGTSYVADIRAGGGNAFDEGFDVAGLTGPVEVIVKSNGVRIQGVVRDAEQKPFASAMVVLVPPRARRENPVLYRTASSDASGSFTFNGVAPGEYKIFAWESINNLAWMNEEFIARYESRGKGITAALGDVAGVEVTVIPRSIR